MRGSKTGLVTQLIEVMDPYLDLHLDPVNTVSALVYIWHIILLTTVGMSL